MTLEFRGLLQLKCAERRQGVAEARLHVADIVVLEAAEVNAVFVRLEESPAPSRPSVCPKPCA